MCLGKPVQAIMTSCEANRAWISSQHLGTKVHLFTIWRAVKWPQTKNRLSTVSCLIWAYSKATFICTNSSTQTMGPTSVLCCYSVSLLHTYSSVHLVISSISCIACLWKRTNHAGSSICHKQHESGINIGNVPERPSLGAFTSTNLPQWYSLPLSGLQPSSHATPTEWMGIFETKHVIPMGKNDMQHCNTWL